MGFIYKITNDINDKIYVGKTCLTVEERFKEHCTDFKRRNYEKRPLYSAMNKYGIDKFHIETLGEYNDDDLAEYEIYWIDYYNSYINGYNATKGGDGKMYFDHNAIIEELRNNPYPIDVAKKFGCSADLVCNLAKKENIKVRNKGSEKNLLSQPKQVHQFDLNGVYIQSFKSCGEASKWCIENGLTSSYNSGRNGIAESARLYPNRKAFGYNWSYVKE